MTKPHQLRYSSGVFLTLVEYNLPKCFLCLRRKQALFFVLRHIPDIKQALFFVLRHIPDIKIRKGAFEYHTIEMEWTDIF